MDWREGGRRRLLKHRHFVSSLSRHRSFAHVTRLVTMQRTRSIASATGFDAGHDVPATCSLAATCARTDGPSADSPVCVRSTAASLLSSRLCILLRLCWLPLDVRRMRLPQPRGRVLRCAHWRTSLGALPARSRLLVHRVSRPRCLKLGLLLRLDVQCHRLRCHRRGPSGFASSCRRTGVVRLCRRRTRFVVRPGSHQYVSLLFRSSRRSPDLANYTRGTVAIIAIVAVRQRTTSRFASALILRAHSTTTRTVQAMPATSPSRSIRSLHPVVAAAPRSTLRTGHPPGASASTLRNRRSRWRSGRGEAGGRRGRARVRGMVPRKSCAREGRGRHRGRCVLQAFSITLGR